MFIRINPKLDWFSSKEKLNNTLLSLRGQWLKVETQHLFDNQYSVAWNGQGLRIYDAWIDRVFNDEREHSVFTNEFGGELPEIKCFDHLLEGEERCTIGHWSIYAHQNNRLAKEFLKKDFNLSFDEKDNHYILTNFRQTNFKFIYHNGKFYEYDGIGYTKVNSLAGKVRSDQIPLLKKLFAEHY
ncbi:hypothetical protein [Vibrio phage RYC]|nr:hypothetical protein [Vibrio phage RYC]